jgi:hypothetical protein
MRISVSPRQLFSGFLESHKYDERKFKATLTDTKEFGFILPSRTTLQRQLAGLRLVNSLLRLGFRIIWISEPSTASTDAFPKGHTYEPGDFLILTNPDSPEERNRDYGFVVEAAARRDVLIHTLLESCDPTGYLLRVPKIAVYRGPGTWNGYLWYTECLRSMGFAHDALAPSEIASGKLRGYDVHVQPGGDETWQAAALWPRGRDEIRSFLENGGYYVGSCGGLDVAGNANGSSLYSPNSGKVKFLNLVTYDCPRNVPRNAYPHDEWARKYWHHIDFTEYSQLVPIGVGTPVPLRVKSQSPILFGYEKVITPGVRYSAGPIAKNLREPMRLIAEFAPELLPLDSPWNVPPEKAMELFKGAAAISEATFGRGRLVFFAPHPEDPGNPEYFRMIANSIFYLTAEGPAKAHTLISVLVQPARRSSTKPVIGSEFEELERTLSETKYVSESLARSLEPIRKLGAWEYRHTPEWLLKLPGYTLILMPDLETTTLEQHISALVSLVPELRQKVQLISQEDMLASRANSIARDICAKVPTRLRRIQEDMKRMISELDNLRPTVDTINELRNRIEPNRSKGLENAPTQTWAELDAKQAELNDRLWREIIFYLDGKAETAIFSVWRQGVVGRDSKGILTDSSEIRTEMSHAIELCDLALARTMSAKELSQLGLSAVPY